MVDENATGNGDGIITIPSMNPIGEQSLYVTAQKTDSGNGILIVAVSTSTNALVGTNSTDA
jgi:hypothetical protein